VDPAVFSEPATIDVDEEGNRLDANEIHDDEELLRQMEEEEARFEEEDARRRAAPYAGGFDTPGSSYSTLSYRSMSARRRSVFSGGRKPRARSTGRRGSSGVYALPSPSPHGWGGDSQHTPSAGRWEDEYGGDVVPPPAPHFG